MGLIVLMTENTTTNHNDNIAREDSVVPCAHGRGSVMLMIKHTTINHGNDIARERNALMKQVMLLGGGGMPLPTETLQGTSSP